MLLKFGFNIWFSFMFLIVLSLVVMWSIVVWVLVFKIKWVELVLGL